MKLEELNLDVAGVVGAPVKITAPQMEWLQARDSGVIPESLFKLYEAAGYLSFGAAPKFLADSDNVLFSYFTMLLRGLRQQLSDGAELLGELKQALKAGLTHQRSAESRKLRLRAAPPQLLNQLRSVLIAARFADR